MNINCEYRRTEDCHNPAIPGRFFRYSRCILLVPKEDIRLVEGCRLFKEKELTSAMAGCPPPPPRPKHAVQIPSQAISKDNTK